MKMKASVAKNIMIGVLVCAFVITLIFALKKSQPAPYDETLINTRINTLEQENTRLEKDIASERKKTASFLIKIDSLVQLKQKVVIKYEKIYEKIDASHASYVVSEFDSVFTANSLK